MNVSVAQPDMPVNEVTALTWVDTHCHLDAPEFDADRMAVRAQARQAGVAHCVIPAVLPAHFDAVRHLAHSTHDSYCLGIHPLYVPGIAGDALDVLERALVDNADDPRLVAVGEMGLDFFVPELCTDAMRLRQEAVYRAQLELAHARALPVVLHVRRSADRLLKHLRAVSPAEGSWRGIAHAFNGSLMQAQAFVRLGFKLGFGGALTYDRALQLRLLARTLPLDALVLETDAPDIPPHWLYATAQQRAQGIAQGRNTPAELPRIAKVMAEVRAMDMGVLARATTANALAALPRIAGLLV